MSVVNRTRNIFVNSEEYHDAKGQVNLVFPGSDFVVDNNEIMRLTLDRFEMKRNFYNINKFNNTFYSASVVSGDDVIQHECKVAEGDYDKFGLDTDSGSLSEAISTAITSTVGTAPTSVKYNQITRKLEISMPTSANVSNFYFLQIPPSRQNNSTAFTDFMGQRAFTDGIFNDSYEIFGAKPMKSEETIVAGLKTTTSGSNTVFTSYYPASLYTMESINLTTNLQTHSYSTPIIEWRLKV